MLLEAPTTQGGTRGGCWAWTQVHVLRALVEGGGQAEDQAWGEINCRESDFGQGEQRSHRPNDRLLHGEDGYAVLTEARVDEGYPA